MSSEEQTALDYFRDTHSRTSTEWYVVNLPLRQPVVPL